MPPNDRHSNQSPSRYDVEVLTADDVWAQFGPKLASAMPAKSSQPGGISWWRVWISSAGALSTLALHGLLLGTILLGTAGRPLSKPVPLTEGAAVASQNENATEFVSVLLFLTNHSITPPDWSPDESAYSLAGKAEQQNAEALIASLEAMQAPQLSGSEGGEDEASPTEEATGNGAGRAILFGRYMGQIKARIERAWSFPLVASSDRFECRVQIKQDRRGEVQEVTLQQCGGDPAWQLSLVQAIQRASPLSGPPDDSVFTEIVTMYFAAQPAAKIVDTSLRLGVESEAHATSGAMEQVFSE